MAQVITIAGEQLFATKAQNNQPLDIDTFIFAMVPGQDPNATIDRNEGLPPLAQRVHQQIVQQTGKINNNVVVYSTVMDSLTGPFEFNWVGLYSSVNNVLVAIQHIPTVAKTVTVPGAAGNILNRNFGLEYSGIAELAGITVAPETWQLDFTARLNGMDLLTRQLAADMNGRDWFIDNGFKVEPRPTVNTFKINTGAGYVNGLRIEQTADHIITLSSYPQFVYVDAWFDGEVNATWRGQTEFVITNTEQSDYTDTNGKQHYLFKLATITAANAVQDHRGQSDLRPPVFASLKHLPTNNLVHGKKYSVISFYDGWAALAQKPVGGGDFVYDANRSWADHNGGTVIALGALNAWNGTKEDLGTLHDYTGAGSGCFIKNIKELYANDFGMVADGVFDNSHAYEKLRAAYPRNTVYWPDNGNGYATSAPLKMELACKNIGTDANEERQTKIIGLGNHAIFEINTGGCEISGFRFYTQGDRENLNTRAIFINGSGLVNYKTHLHHLYSGSKFNTFIYSNTEVDQSWFHDIVTFNNHKRGAIDIDTRSDASAPTGAAKIERIWVTPTDFNPSIEPPAMFGIRLGRTDSTSVENCIINGTQNDIWFDNSGDVEERNWVPLIKNLHSEKRWAGAGGATPPARWESGQSVSAGDIRRPSRLNANGYVYKAQNSGVTGETEPTWPKNNYPGTETSVTDNGITWLPWYSSVGIRFTGAVSSNTLIKSTQIDNHLVAVLDVGNNIGIEGFRVFGSVDKVYKRTVNTGVDTVLSFSQSSLTVGGFDLLEGSSRTFVDFDSTTIASDAFGIPSNIKRTTKLESSRRLTEKFPTLLTGDTQDLAKFKIPVNNGFNAKVVFEAKTLDASFVQREFANVELKLNVMRVASGNPVVNINPLEEKILTGSFVFDFNYTTSFVNDEFTVSVNVTADRPNSQVRIAVSEIDVMSSGRSVELL